MARRLYAYAFSQDFVLLYPVYAVLFADTGLSTAEISSLFVIWSVTAIALEVPSGLWADVFSRRRLLVVAPVLCSAGFATWTFFPSYLAFAIGFMLWGAGGALRSGTLQALVYEELDRVGAAESYARLMGRSEAVGMTAVMVASAVAAPVLAAGGYLALGVASVAVPLLGSLAGWTFPESRAPQEHEDGFVKVLREGIAEVRRSPRVRSALVLVTAISSTGALDEYIPLLAEATGVDASTVPLLVLLVTIGSAIGGWLAGRGTRWAAPVLAAAAVLLAVGAVGGSPWGMTLVAAAYGAFQWAMTAAETRLQERITDAARATVTSMAGFGTDVAAVLIYAAYGLASERAGPGPLFGLAAVPYLGIALALWLSGRRGGDQGR
ncbi:MFS transporter [Sphaerisporangium corydalis]|uniref:MFS transporter n=1 Tax=Sphaerisporangium corydalis TaxID=1441875 RepID=A0ABV9ETG3_9ACTN|nr:MFS transporter [Sphaerisporangium corydalis]